MKKQLLKTLIKHSFVFLLLLASANISLAGATNNWTGATSSDWNTAGNWSSGIPKSTDAVQIGVVAYTNSSNQPTLSAAGTCSSITIGNTSGAVTLTINTGFTLTVSGAFTINTPTTISIVNNGTLSVGTYANNGTTAFGSGVFTVTSTASTAFNNNSGSTSFGSGTVNIAGDFNNTSGTTTFGTGLVTLSGSFTNTAGTTTFGTGLVTFNSTSSSTKIQMIPDAVLVFVNVTFSNGQFNFKSLTTANAGFALASTGVMTLSSGGRLVFSNTSGITLYSDVNSSATIAAIPAGCSISASNKVSVQRFIKGSSDMSKRGYRLMSSPIYTGNDGTSNVFDFQYLLNSIYVSGAGTTANGFNVTTTQNPSIYLFREDVTPPPSNSTLFYTGYNWKGVAKINNSPAYNIGTQAKNTTANVFNATVTVPVGNGVLVFFRGDQTLSTTIYPFSAPKDVTLTQTGTLNIGTVNVRLWFATDAALGNNLSYTSATTAANSGSTSSLTGGFTLVGNPYASTINWEKFNRNGANSSIYGGAAIDNTIYMFNVSNKQYEAYQQKSAVTSVADTTTAINPGTATGSASNMIASGQGFFIQTFATGQTFSFRETAKTNTQPVASSLNKLMGKPVAFAAAPNPLLRLKLSKDSINTDEIVIRLNNNTSAKYVQGEDAIDLGGSGALVTLSAFSSDSIKLAINYMPFPGLQQQVTPLLVEATASGLYKLERTQLANLPALYDVWLKDAFMNDSLDMKANSVYEFKIDKSNPATFGRNRFTLVIRQNPANAYRLLDFNAARVGSSSHVEVVWNTENEQNYTNFTVERSNDGGKTFAAAGGLQGTGAGAYSLVDKNAVIGSNLYRLKQEDLNNTITYSKVVEVLIDDKGNGIADQIHVYPNPAINVINLDVTAKAQGNTSYNIIVTNSSGFTIKQATSSQATWQSGVSDLLPGTYLVKVVNTKDKSLVGQSKFVKL